jgi:hypothetical protein
MPFGRHVGPVRRLLNLASLESWNKTPTDLHPNGATVYPKTMRNGMAYRPRTTCGHRSAMLFRTQTQTIQASP